MVAMAMSRRRNLRPTALPSNAMVIIVGNFITICVPGI
jgi:hypothetical protein